MLGDLLSSALASVGVTPERVERWTGGPCGCEERRRKLNALDAWARQSAKLAATKARAYLEDLLSEDES